MGFGNSIKMIRKLEKELKGTYFIVSCGNNKKMLEDIRNDYKNKENVIALPYINNLSEYMRASEIILTKPGGLTSTEVANVGKPLIHTMPIPGCENYNAEYFSKRKMSIKCDTLNDVIKNTKMLLSDKKLQNELVENQRRIINRNTCEEITSLILKF